MIDLLTINLAMAPQGGGDGGGGMISMLIMFGLLFVVMYFFMIRPQQKRQKEHNKMLESLRKGDKVVTTAGMHGTITEVQDKTVVLQLADNMKVTFEKASIASKK